ncbi:hypothetical protein HY988_06295 [Candidatus Micrarchaeota archaeon]|nr:hypothetical protein [Candidatus Micrarchaeota archaeon]
MIQKTTARMPISMPAFASRFMRDVGNSGVDKETLLPAALVTTDYDRYRVNGASSPKRVQISCAQPPLNLITLGCGLTFALLRPGTPREVLDAYYASLPLDPDHVLVFPTLGANVNQDHQSVRFKIYNDCSSRSQTNPQANEFIQTKVDMVYHKGTVRVSLEYTITASLTGFLPESITLSYGAVDLDPNKRGLKGNQFADDFGILSSGPHGQVYLFSGYVNPTIPEEGIRGFRFYPDGALRFLEPVRPHQAPHYTMFSKEPPILFGHNLNEFYLDVCATVTNIVQAAAENLVARFSDLAVLKKY